MLVNGVLTTALATLALGSPVEASHGEHRRRQEPGHGHENARRHADQHAQARAAEQGFNPYHAHRDVLKRAVTADATDIAQLTYDFIVVGGGLAGLVIASRLSEVVNQTVLVIEAGGDGGEVETNQDIPGYTYFHGVASGTPYGWNFTTVNQTAAGTTKPLPLGRGLGGSGAVNGMFWGRGAAAEYDAWAELNPNTNVTWNWAEMNKYIMKAENLSLPPQETIDQFNMPIDTNAHGSDGPLHVGWSQHIFPVIANWIPTWVNLGFSSHDLSDGTTRGVMITPSTLNAANQSRSDARRGYIDPNRDRGNLFVLTNHQVTKIIFNGTKDSSGNLVASGVNFQADGSSPSLSAYAAKEIIVTSGAVGSPKVLQLSGIGPADYLSSIGVASVVDLPVGHNFQDHASHTMFWDTVEGIDTWFGLRDEATAAAALTEYENGRTGLWTYINEAVAYASQPDLSGGASEAANFANSVDVNAMVSALASKYGMNSAVQAGVAAQFEIQKKWLTQDVGNFEFIMHLLGKSATSIGIQVCLQHAFSRGTVMISSSDPFAMPYIDPNYLGVDIDVTMVMLATEFIRKYAQTDPMSTILTTEAVPGAETTGDALAAHVKTTVGTEYHPMSSCSMLPKDKGGVVDTRLVVYGTSNVRVADASIMPVHVSAHLMASTYGVAEKVSDLIKEEQEAKAKAAAAAAAKTSSISKTATSTSAPKSATSAPSSSGSSTASKSSAGDSSISTGAKIGIGIGAGVAAILIAAALIYFFMHKKAAAQPTTLSKQQYAQRWPGTGSQDSSYPMNNHGSSYTHSDNPNTIATYDLPPATRPGGRF